MCEARRILEADLAIKRRIHDPYSTAAVLYCLGLLALEEQNLASAGDLLREGLRIQWELGDRPGMAPSLEAVASLAARDGAMERSVRLYSAAALLREAIGMPLRPVDRPRVDKDIATARAALGGRAFAAIWQSGQALSPAEVIHDALSGSEV